MEHQAVLIPPEFYYVAGVLLMANVGTLVTLILVGARAIWWASKMDSGVKDAKACAVRAHTRIDNVEGRLE